MEMAECLPNVICLYNKFGYCKYGENCRRKHENRICHSENCHIEICSKRHPRKCRYFATYKYCKFNQYCRYSHCEIETEDRSDTSEDNESNKNYYKDIIAGHLNEIEFLKAEIIEKDNEISNLKEEIDKTYKEVADLQEMVVYRNDIIEELKEENEKLANSTLEIQSNNVQENNVNGKVQEELFCPDDSTLTQNTQQCDKCEFKSTSVNGIKIHKARKHKDKNYYPS